LWRELESDFPPDFKRLPQRFESRLGFESFFEAKVDLAYPFSSTEKGLVVVVSCSLQGPNNVRGNTIVLHSEAGLLNRKGLV
jgi:hypothetical protein